jgi:hypothetical protein
MSSASIGALLDRKDGSLSLDSLRSRRVPVTEESGHFRPDTAQQKPLLPRAALLISAPSSSLGVAPQHSPSLKSPAKMHGNPTAQITSDAAFCTARVKSGETALIRGFDDDSKSTFRPCRFAPSRLPIGGRNHFLTLKCRKSGGGWSFLIGIKLPSAPSIYCSLPMNTSLRSSVQLFSVHITVGKRL